MKLENIKLTNPYLTLPFECFSRVKPSPLKQSFLIHANKDVAKILGVSQATISLYRSDKIYPSLRGAAIIYGRYGYQTEPYTELALQSEWEYAKKYGTV